MFKKNCVQRISNKKLSTVLQAIRMVNDHLNSINWLNQQNRFYGNTCLLYYLLEYKYV